RAAPGRDLAAGRSLFRRRYRSVCCHALSIRRQAACGCRINSNSLLPGRMSWPQQRLTGGLPMKQAIQATLIAAVAACALTAMTGQRVYAQAADPNEAPNPYKMVDSWAQLPTGQKFGGVIKAQVDHSDGKTMWVFDRCGATECTNSTASPLLKF